MASASLEGHAAGEHHPPGSSGWGVYVTLAGAKNLRHYRYAGSDNSYMYRYVCSPLADTLVKHFVPLWVAPNLITCFGLWYSVLGHSLIWYYSADLQAPCPSWCWSVLGFCTLAYQTLDNMDGKQARRTGSSSPLGLLFDHGIDALNISLSSLNAMAMLQVGSCRIMCMLIYVAGAAPFFCATWEEYHTGYLRLGCFNGPTDGVLILAASQLLCAWVEDYGSFWACETWLGLSRKTWFVGFYLVSVCFTVLGNFASVVSIGRREGRLWSALLQLVPFCTSLALMVLCLSTASGMHLFSSSPRLLFWLAGLAFLKMVVHLQLAHICAVRYEPWMVSLLLPALILVAISAASCLADDSAAGGQLAEAWDFGVILLQGGVVWLAVVCLHLSWCAVREVAAALGLCVFTIPSSNAEKRSE